MSGQKEGLTGAIYTRRLKRKHRGYGDVFSVEHRELIPETIHSTDRHENNRVEKSHEATGSRERGRRKLKSVRQAQRFLDAHAAVSNLFNLGRHGVCAQHYRDLSISAFSEWRRSVALGERSEISSTLTVNLSEPMTESAINSAMSLAQDLDVGFMYCSAEKKSVAPGIQLFLMMSKS